MFADVNEALKQHCKTLWVTLDHLDVAFAESEDLEVNALRALFRVYADFLAYDHLFLKIFLRSDIWRRITEAGFREASHVTRTLEIHWDPSLLLNLVVKRITSNTILCKRYSVDPLVELSADQQHELFYRIFPAQVDLGKRRPSTFDWMLSRTRDSSGLTAPRELIHLLMQARVVQIKYLATGQPDPDGELLFDRQAVRGALPEVSKVRLEQTIYAEYPNVRDRLQALSGQKTLQTLDTLASIWEIPQDQAAGIASQLVEIGFFEQRGSRARPEYDVPFLYRPALSLIQGRGRKTAL